MRTPEEFTAEMQRIKDNNDDLENMHIALDELMCDQLKQLGYTKGVEIFEQQEKWYA